MGNQEKEKLKDHKNKDAWKIESRGASTEEKRLTKEGKKTDLRQKSNHSVQRRGFYEIAGFGRGFFFGGAKES